VTRAISWGRCSLIGLLVVMPVVVVLVLLFISFPVGGVGRGGACPRVICSLLLLSVFGSVASYQFLQLLNGIFCVLP